MKKSLILLMLLPTFAQATPFETRVEAGYKASETKAGRDYEASVGIFIGKAMRECVPANAELVKDYGNFTFVSWVDSTGKSDQLEVMPKNQVSNCFLTKFGHMTLPYPPKSGLTAQGYPLTIYMKLAP